MSKEIENVTCDVCESQFRLVYVTGETSGYAKFCPFCAEELHNEESKSDESEYDDE